MIVRDFNTPLRNGQIQKEENQDIVELDSNKLLEIIAIYILLYPTAAKHTFFSSSNVTFIKVDQI